MSKINKYYNSHTLWIVMLLLTLSTYWMGKIGFSGVIAIFLLLLTTIIKATIIIRDFMELRDVSLVWRIMMYGWLWGICIAISISYLISL
ncbi:MAG: cytochrome C oxidase subunit IV family protein [Thiotrichaceae bacterium]|nr:cytochrome C oxidase subunit IV family protein [Thiotrichaceae bacterium]